MTTSYGPPAEELATARLVGAANSALATLRERLGLRSWVLARRQGRGWVVVTSLDAELAPGTPLPGPWTALCDRLAETGPTIAPSAESPVGAYAGTPLRLPGGRIVGVVCGADPAQQPEGVGDESPFLTLAGELLSAVLAAELRAVEQTRRAETAEAVSRRDSLTGLGNRYLWDRLLVKEEERCRRMGLEAAVIVVDLDRLKEVNDERGHAAGDDLLRLSARILSEYTRELDEVARIGGDEFAIVATDCGPDDLQAMVARLAAALTDAAVSASIGAAVRDPENGLEGAWGAADSAMYVEKRHKRESQG